MGNLQLSWLSCLVEEVFRQCFMNISYSIDGLGLKIFFSENAVVQKVASTTAIQSYAVSRRVPPGGNESGPRS